MVSQSTSWQQFEKAICQIASYRWNCPAVAETINGVKLDCVLKPEPDRWICVEITEEKDLAKLRTDLAKFASIRPALFAKDIYCECFFVCGDLPPPSLRDTGLGHHVHVVSRAEFESALFDFSRYAHARSLRSFGSAIDRLTGDQDRLPYIAVKYEGLTESGSYSLQDLEELLTRGKHVVLVGPYGTGKSRCVQELFHRVVARPSQELRYCLSLDLRAHWGAKRANELVRRHLEDLGMTEAGDPIIRVLNKNHVMFLLDGFDELGSQTWSDNPERLKDIRKASLVGVKDLLATTKAGVLITGREHYFNSEDEMFECLGLDSERTVILKCSEQFTEQEMNQYLASIAPGVSLPTWLPRRPLICNLVATLDKTALNRLLSTDAGEYEFWDTLIQTICDREAKINPALDSLTIRRVLVRLARATRTKAGDVGPISIPDISQAFENVVGSRPGDESVTMLSRLPPLGRIGADSPDRQFVDTYILDGLRAEDLNEAVASHDEEAKHQRWTQPLRRLGLSLVAQEMKGTGQSDKPYFQYMKLCANNENQQAAADLFAAFVASDAGSVDFQGLALSGVHLTQLDLSVSKVSNATISDSIIEELELHNADPTNVTLQRCEIGNIYGVSTTKGLPSWIRECRVETFDSVSTLSRIKLADLSHAQRIFVGLIKKTFFQPGSGRKEEALYRGFGSDADARTVTKLLHRMITEDLLRKVPGSEGPVYIPNRRYARRMQGIMDSLSLSTDPLWEEVSKMR